MYSRTFIFKSFFKSFFLFTTKEYLYIKDIKIFLSGDRGSLRYQFVACELYTHDIKIYSVSIV